MKCKYLLVLVGWALCSSACVFNQSFEVYDGFFNPRLRPDLASFDIALPPSDPNYFTYEPGSYYTAGGEKGDAFVSPVFFTFRGGNGWHQDLEGLHHSECFWMHVNDRAYVAWEVVGKFRPQSDCEDCPELHPEKNSAGACKLGHPYTRSPMETVEGEQLPIEVEPGLEDFKFVKVHRFHFGSGALERSLYADQYNECRFITPPLQESVAVLDGPCASDAEGSFALCMKHGCHIPIPHDSSLMFELDARIEGLGGAYNRFYPKPHIKVVNQPRTLSRQMHYDGARAGETPASIFRWTVPVLGNNRWQENFSPSLKIVKLKTFKRAANGQMTSIRPIYYEANGVFCDNPRQTPDDDIFTVCPLSQAVYPYTPTYTPADKDTPLTWTMLFNPGDAGASDEVFVEFTVSDAVGPEGGVLLSPLALDFGRVVTGTRVTRQIFVENTGRTDISVDKFVQSSDNATEFALQLPAGVALPFILAPGDLMALDVSAIPANIGSSEKSMTVEVVALGVVSGKEVKSQMEMRYQEITGPQANVIPRPLVFHRDPCEPELRYRRRMLLENVGHVSMTRRNPPRIEGAVPDAFQIISTHNPTATYGPAEIETFRVEFDPSLINGAPGDYAAELVFDTDATSAVVESTYFSNGEIRLPLEGRYGLSCQ